MDVFQDIWHWICDLVVNAIEWIVDILPDSPFKALSNTPIRPYLGYINYFVPMDFIVNVLTLWLVAVAGYYTWSVLLRWIKAID